MAIPTGRAAGRAFLIPGVSLSNVGRRRHQHHQHHRRVVVRARRQSRRHTSADRRRDDCEHGRHRIFGQHAAEHGQHAGSRGRLLCRHRGEHQRRTADQHDPENRRQQLPGTLFATGANSSFQGSNTDAALVARGLATPNSVKPQSRHQSGIRRPAQAGRLWFYTSGRFTNQAELRRRPVPEQERRRHHEVDLRPDTADQAVNAANENSVNLRLTWQASPKRKLNFFYDQHCRCQCAVTSPVISQEAANQIHYPISDLRSVSYTVTPSNRMLIEARFGERREEYAVHPDAGHRSAALTHSGRRTGRIDSGPAVSRRRHLDGDAAVSANARREHPVRPRRWRT